MAAVDACSRERFDARNWWSFQTPPVATASGRSVFLELPAVQRDRSERAKRREENAARQRRLLAAEIVATLEAIAEAGVVRATTAEAVLDAITPYATIVFRE